MRLWFFPLALSFGVALEVKPIPEAVLVVREEVLEGGEVKAYVGTKRQRVASEQELRALIRAWTQEPRPPRFVWEGGRWRGVEKVGRTFDEEEA
ncbi:MAG: vancomycin resistance protein, partial [Thermus sp.]